MGVWYRTGTVNVTNGSPNIVGVGTLWLTQASIGDIFNGPDGVEYEITAITDDTHAAIKQRLGTAAYAGSTLTAQAYSIVRNFTSTLPALLASQLAAMITAWHQTTDEFTAWLSGTGNVTVHDSVGNAYSLATPAALGGPTSGRLSKSVAGGATVTLSATEVNNLFLEFTGVLTASINVVVPSAARSYFVLNSTTGAYTLTVKTAAGTGIVVPQGGRALLECDATNVLHPLANLVGNVTVAGTLAVAGASSFAAVSAGALTATSFAISQAAAVLTLGTAASYGYVGNDNSSAYFLLYGHSHATKPGQAEIAGAVNILNGFISTTGVFSGQVALTKSGGGGGAGAALNITAAAAGIGFVDTGGGTNGKNWDILVVGGTFNIRALTDADGAPQTILCATRTASSTAITGLQLGASATAITTPGHVAGTPTWVTGDKYLVVDSSGHHHVSAIGPAS
jgi:hypothetical protein